MNVAFHELAALAITQETAARLGPPRAGTPTRAARAGVWAVAIVLGLASHGILDALPHYYPLGSWPDVGVSLALLGVWLWLVPRWVRLPLVLVCLAAVLPDFVDHTIRLLNRHFALGLPDHRPLFPWHWRSGSGSYPGRTGPLWRESLTNHLIVLLFAGVSLWRTRALLERRDPVRGGIPPA
jgi:hypothetical protein